MTSGRQRIVPDAWWATAWAQIAGRAVNTVFFLFTSVYCVLTYSPFAYEQFIQPHVIAWLSNFVLLFADLYWLVLCITALTLVPVLRSSPLRIAAWIYLAAASAVGIAVTLRPVLPGGANPAASLWGAFTALIPVIWLAGLDHLAANAGRSTNRLEPRDIDSPAPGLQRVCIATAAFVWATYSTLAIVRLRAAGGLTESAGALLVGVAMSAVAHVMVFALLFVALTTIARLTSGSPRGTSVAFVARTLLWCVGAALVLQRVVFTPIAITGGVSWALAATVGAAVVLSLSGLVRLHDRVPPSRVGAGITLFVLPVAAYAVLSVVTTFDWGFMLQKLSAIGIATVAFAAIRVLMGHQFAAADRGRVGLPVAAMVLFATGTIAAPRLSAWTHDPALETTFALDAYTAGDPSYRLIRQFFDRDQALRGDAEFYAYLRANTSIQDPVAPVSVDFVTRFDSGLNRPPDVFLFLIDSLRRDYVSPYNPAVTFTPSIEAFARESFSFARAFTRYGGTGLAVPSVWAGAMLIHKQYVTPFAPTNALAKLLDADGYRRAVTFDHITDELFGFPEGDTTLDRAVPEMTHTFCGTVDEIEADLREHTGDRRPVFAHTRPLDLHIGNTRFARVPAGETYPGFFEPYASRVHRIDACFGGFIEFLKRTNRYDNSIVIVMSDHGDSLGEGLRWGHGYTVFPEVIRIPLIIHLPPDLRDRVKADLERVSFATDITPTLYALLGHEPVRPRSVAGSPLFATATEALADRSSESFVVASSYGAVYGLLRQNGRRLYIADAIEGRDYLFDITRANRDVRIGLTDAERLSSRTLIREQVTDLAGWYGRR